MASKLYGWDVRNIAKISPIMAKKQSFFDFFRFSQKLSIRFERNFLQLFYTILESYMCNGIKIVWLGCEKQSQNQPNNGQKTAILRLFSSFSKTVHTILTKFCTLAVLLHHIMVLCVQFQKIRMTGIGASQKEKDLSRLLYRICGSGLKKPIFFLCDIFLNLFSPKPLLNFY